MYVNESVHEKLKKCLQEIDHYAGLLYYAPCVMARNVIVNKLRQKISEASRLIAQPGSNTLTPSYGNPVAQLNPQNQTTFTLEELSKYNGKDGNPAYVAVNGVVYDVTNNAAWAAATHFGLNAGKDLTDEFSSCHAGQNILSKLKVVGKLVQ